MERKIKVMLLLILAGLGVGSLIGAILSKDSPGMAIAFLVITGLCVVATLVYYLYSPASNPSVNLDVHTETPDGVKGRAELAIRPTEIGRPEWTSTAIAPTIRRVEDGADRSEQEKKVLEELASLLQTGIETDYSAVTRLLEEHKETLQRSWRLQINYGNCLIMQGNYEPAREIAEAVLHNFGGVPHAEARAHGLLVLYHDGRTPDTKGKLRDEILEQQLRHVELGISADPECVPLYLNGFEIRCEKDELEKALDYLTRAALVDQKGAKRAIERAIEEDEELRRKLAEDAQLSEFLGSLGIELGEKDDEDE